MDDEKIKKEIESIVTTGDLENLTVKGVIATLENKSLYSCKMHVHRCLIFRWLTWYSNASLRRCCRCLVKCRNDLLVLFRMVESCTASTEDCSSPCQEASVLLPCLVVAD